MAEEEKGALRSVVWSELLPWLSIFRTFRLAIGIRVLILAAVASLLTILCWVVLGMIFSGDDELPVLISDDARCPWVSVAQVVPEGAAFAPPAPTVFLPSVVVPTNVPHGESAAWGQISRPFYNLFRLATSVSGGIYLVLCGLASLAVWAFFGGAITRMVAVQLACEERISLADALRYACSKWGAYFAAPLFPLIGVLLASLPIIVLGLLMKAGVGIFLAGLVWPLALVGGLLMAVLLLGLMFGWPLMWATISAEGTDSFDALSRSYAYVFQRPLHLLFYVIVAALFGGLGWLLVSGFTAAVAGLAYWAASWGSDATRMTEIISPEGLEGIGRGGAVLILFWVGCIKLVAAGFLSTYFWSAATAVYFLLRRDVDATEMDEVFLEEDEDQETYGLPPMSTDAEGAPVVSDEETQGEETP